MEHNNIYPSLSLSLMMMRTALSTMVLGMFLSNRDRIWTLPLPLNPSALTDHQTTNPLQHIESKTVLGVVRRPLLLLHQTGADYRSWMHYLAC